MDGGETIGVVVRLLETLGKPGAVRLAALRPIGAARQVDFLGGPIVDVAVEDGQAVVELAGHEYLQLEVRWKP
jgi:hypothetical protein